MSKRQTKAQASSSRASAGGGFVGGFGSSGFRAGTFGGSASTLSYLGEQPDLTTVSDANVVVNFKNLTKKDSTTKAKALEDLQTFVSTSIGQGQELEEGFLDAWVGEFRPLHVIQYLRILKRLSIAIIKYDCITCLIF